MKLSLMILNLIGPVFFDQNLQLKENPDINKYEELLRVVSEAGYRAVDLTDMECSEFGIDTLRELLDKYKLDCGSITLFEDYACKDENLGLRVKEYTFKVIQDAQNIGCKTIMLAPVQGHPEMTREEKQQCLINNLKTVVNYASERDITICVEDFPSIDMPMCRSEDMEYLLSNVAGLKLTYDTSNMIVEGEDPIKYYDRLKKYVGYCHLKDVRFAEKNEQKGDHTRDGRRLIPTIHGKGCIDFRTAIERLREDDYQGYLAVEYAPDREEEDTVKILSDERRYFENILQNV